MLQIVQIAATCRKMSQIPSDSPSTREPKKEKETNLSLSLSFNILLFCQAKFRQNTAQNVAKNTQQKSKSNQHQIKIKLN